MNELQEAIKKFVNKMSCIIAEPLLVNGIESLDLSDFSDDDLPIITHTPYIRLDSIEIQYEKGDWKVVLCNYNSSPFTKYYFYPEQINIQNLYDIAKFVVANDAEIQKIIESSMEEQFEE